MKPLPVRFMAVLFILAVGLSLLSPFPIHAQDPSLAQTIESDDPHVLPSGTWSSQATSAASNGSYLYSSGAENDILGLSFVGAAIEIIYVAGPSLGTLAIEVDGTVVRTLITTADQIAYAQSARVDYLSDEPHALKIYAQAGGIVAIDAFVITPHSATALVENDDAGSAQSSPCTPVTVTHLVSKDDLGQQAAFDSSAPVISTDGRYVAFLTDNVLVPGDSNGLFDVYLYDRLTCQVELISVSSAEVGSNGNSGGPRMTGDGRYVTFYSIASNLVTGDSNATHDVFVRDRQLGTTTRVSVVSGGGQANFSSLDSALSADGRYVAFWSLANNLVANDTNARPDVFVHDRQTGNTTRVSVATGGAQSTGGDAAYPSISADGRYVTFHSDSPNLVAGDTNARTDIFVHDRQTGNTTRVSVATGGAQGNNHSTYPAISADGRYVAYDSSATNLVAVDTNGNADVFVFDRQTATTTRVSVATGGAQANGGGVSPILSDNGRYVVFSSGATNLVTGDTNGLSDIFVHDRQTGVTTRINLGPGGQALGGDSFQPAIAGNGQYIAFTSSANNLIGNDSNGSADVFVAPLAQPARDTLALFQSSYQGVVLVDTLADSPAPSHFTFYSAYAPVNGGQWIMGDWDGDGLKTPGVYRDGAFHYTNDAGETKTWHSLWIGLNGPIVAGRVDGNYDCFGVIDSANFPPYGLAFVLYITCDLSGNPTPPLLVQWLSVLLPDAAGFSGTFQFVMGDWNGDGIDTVACRRGPFIAWTNDSALNISAGFPFAQYIGAPASVDEGLVVAGDWDGNNTDSFGLFYQNGEFFYRNDLDFNSGVYLNQSVGTPFAGTVQAATWR